ncbi:MAG: hypothetical protein IKR97_03360, partial [Eubacterium sp.]|nr:hypothetical protein [Eubacterium sp.]
NEKEMPGFNEILHFGVGHYLQTSFAENLSGTLSGLRITPAHFSCNNILNKVQFLGQKRAQSHHQK